MNAKDLYSIEEARELLYDDFAVPGVRPQSLRSQKARGSFMSNRLHPEGRKIELTFTVSTEAQARELDAAWREIIVGKQPRTNILERDQGAIAARALGALELIEATIRHNPTTGQAGRLVRFLAGVYNGYDYPFDLTDLRALDTRLANACLDYLNYDRLGKKKVHRHLSNGERELHQWIEDYGVELCSQPAR